MHDRRAFYSCGLSDIIRGEYQQGVERYNIALNVTEAIADRDKALISNELGAAQILLKQYQAAIANRVLGLKDSIVKSRVNQNASKPII